MSRRAMRCMTSFLRCQFACTSSSLDSSSARRCSRPTRLPDDDIDLAALVLERQERHAVRALRPLTHEHDAGGAHCLPLATQSQLVRRSEVDCGQPLAQQRQGMAPEREPDRGVVGDDALLLRWALAARAALRSRSPGSTRARIARRGPASGKGALGARHLPERQMSIATQRSKRARRRQRLEVAPIERGTLARSWTLANGAAVRAASTTLRACLRQRLHHPHPQAAERRLLHPHAARACISSLAHCKHPPAAPRLHARAHPAPAAPAHRIPSAGC